MDKKVLFITNAHPIPNYRRLWKKVTSLADDGYQVRAICPMGLKKPGRKRMKKADVHYYYKKETQASTTYSYVRRELSDLLKVSFIALGFYLRRQFRLIHLVNPSDTLVLVALFYRLLGYQFVYERGESNPEKYRREHFNKGGFLYELLGWLERLAVKQSRLIIVPDYKDKKELVDRYGIKKNKVVTIEPLPDLKDFYQPVTDQSLRRGFPHLALYSGSLKVERGLVRLLTSIDFIVNGLGRRDILFVLAGTGKDLKRLVEFSEKKGVTKYVYFAGWLNQEKLLGYLAAADIGIAPEPLHASGTAFRDSILEYMALGKPVVSFASDMHKRKIGPAGMFVGAYNKEELAWKILQLIDNEKKRQSMGEAGRVKVERGMNWLRSELKLLAAYDSMFRRTPLFKGRRLVEHPAV